MILLKEELKMGLEIERKFLVKDTAILQKKPCVPICQGYIPAGGAEIRLRLIADQAFLTIKSTSKELTRAEYEYSIPVSDAREMLDLFCSESLIEKERYSITDSGRLWEVDLFHGRNEGLVLAEVELATPNTPLNLPEWLGREVTGIPDYYNENLQKHPYMDWKEHNIE